MQSNNNNNVIIGYYLTCIINYLCGCLEMYITDYFVVIASCSKLHFGTETGFDYITLSLVLCTKSVKRKS